MDIERVNSVLTKAIMGLQEGELQAMVEAMAMTPDDLGWMNPSVTVPLGVAAKSKGYPEGLVQRLFQLKRDAPGVQSVKQRRVGRRTTDLEIRFRGGGTIGVTVEPNLVSLAGGRGMVRTGGRSVPEVYFDVVKFIRRHARSV
jgi:hypothetical protein